MMKFRQNVRPYFKVFDDLQVEVVDTSVTGSSHYRFLVTSNGNRGTFIAPRSSSDHRALRNFKSQVKRWKRALQQETFS